MPVKTMKRSVALFTILACLAFTALADVIIAMREYQKTNADTGVPVRISSTNLYFKTATIYGKKSARVNNTGNVWIGMASTNDTQFGWTVGGGVEIMRHANWSVRAEGLYVDLGDESEHYELTGCGFGCEARVGFEDEFWVARVGLAYHFGGREEVAPLK